MRGGAHGVSGLDTPELQSVCLVMFGRSLRGRHAHVETEDSSSSLEHNTEHAFVPVFSLIHLSHLQHHLCGN